METLYIVSSLIGFADHLDTLAKAEKEMELSARTRREKSFHSGRADGLAQAADMLRRVRLSPDEKVV